MIAERLLDRTEVVGITALFERDLATRSRAGARHLLRIPAVRGLASDTRLIALAAYALGGSPIPFRATLFDKSPASNWLVSWHQDTALPLRERVDCLDWGPWSVKAGVLHARAPAAALQHIVALRVHLDNSTSANGPLRVLPNTHALGVLSDKEISRLSHDSQPRRVLHIEYASHLVLEPGIELAVAE
jgi:ectoine hydroxylase-related dioxygenase (phytanoyl-CoA dioxygenase family)